MLQLENAGLRTEVDELARANERLQAQFDLLDNILQNSVQLQRDLAESRQLCSQLQSQLADSLAAQQLVRDNSDRQTSALREELSQAQQQATSWSSLFDRVYSALLGAQTLLDPQSARFDFRSSDFSDVVHRFFSAVSSRVLPPGSSALSAITSRDVQIDELTEANLAYARDLRELRASVAQRFVPRR